MKRIDKWKKERSEAIFFPFGWAIFLLFSSCPMREAYAIRPYTYRPKGASRLVVIPYIYTDMTLSPPPLGS